MLYLHVKGGSEFQGLAWQGAGPDNCFPCFLTFYSDSILRISNKTFPLFTFYMAMWALAKIHMRALSACTLINIYIFNVINPTAGPLYKQAQPSIWNDRRCPYHVCPTSHIKLSFLSGIYFGPSAWLSSYTPINFQLPWLFHPTQLWNVQGFWESFTCPLAPFSDSVLSNSTKI